MRLHYPHKLFHYQSSSYCQRHRIYWWSHLIYFMRLITQHMRFDQGPKLLKHYLICEIWVAFSHIIYKQIFGYITTLSAVSCWKIGKGISFWKGYWWLLIAVDIGNSNSWWVQVIIKYCSFDGGDYSRERWWRSCQFILRFQLSEVSKDGAIFKGSEHGCWILEKACFKDIANLITWEG